MSNLQVTNNLSSTAQYVKDAANNSSPLSLSTVKVGVGTDAPSSLLHIETSQDALTSLTIKNPNLGSSAAAELKLTSDSGNSLVYRTSNAYGYGLSNCLVIQNSSGNADTVFWMYGGAEAMRIKNDGKIGIGTATPGAVFEITKSVTSSGTPDPYNFACGTKFNQTITAHENGVYLAAATINPTFNDNGKVSLTKHCLQIRPLGSYTDICGINLVIPSGSNVTTGIFVDVGGSGHGIQCAVQGSGTAISGRAEGSEADSCGGLFTAKESNQYALKTLIGLVTFGGSVGIGVAPPSERLDVNGNVKISGSGKGLILTQNTSTPGSPVDGMIAYADGSGWNPGGQGKGIYAYYNSTWNKLG